MTIVEKLNLTADRINAILNIAMDNRDAAATPNKTKWRRVASRLERGLKHIEAAINEAERI